MLKKSLIAAAAIATGTVAAMPASAAPAGPFRGAVLFWLLDRNENGAIEKAEIDALRNVIFDSVDVNHDGRVTQDELSAAVEAVRKVRQMRHDGDGAPAQLMPIADRIAEHLGVGPDGLAKADFIGREPRLFSRADANGDDSVSRTEFESAGIPLGRLMMMD
jgi:hypothetical protein